MLRSVSPGGDHSSPGFELGGAENILKSSFFSTGYIITSDPEMFSSSALLRIYWFSDGSHDSSAFGSDDSGV